jgi:hypothetical protein
VVLGEIVDFLKTFECLGWNFKFYLQSR